MPPERPRLEFFLVAESYSVDQETNRLSIFDVLVNIVSSGKVAMLNRVAAICEWIIPTACIDKDYLAMLRVVSPSGKCTEELKLAFTGKASRHRLYLRILGARFETAGRWVFELLLDGEHVASHEVDVQLEQPGILAGEPERWIKPGNPAKH